MPENESPLARPLSGRPTPPWITTAPPYPPQQAIAAELEEATPGRPTPRTSRVGVSHVPDRAPVPARCPSLLEYPTL